MSGTLTFIIAFVVVLGLIGLIAWLVRRFASNRLGAATQRGRMPRLAVIDAAAVDGRRRLVLVRRDNIEHLLMIGGPTDIVVEPNIVRAAPARDALPQRSASAEASPRIAPLPDAAWDDGEDAFPHPEPQMPEPPPRPGRPAFSDDLRRASAPPMPMPPPERRSESLTGFAPEPMGREARPEPNLRAEARAEPRVEAREPRADARVEPLPPRMPREPMMPRTPRQGDPSKTPMRMPDRSAAPPPPPPPPSAAQTADPNLAEMAQRLEAALRRPSAAAAEAPPVAPEPASAPARPVRIEPPAPPAPTPSPKTSFENLEDEMASLLGRPKSSSS